ncbi:MAG: right-handed parallel beta-helix repeat-containing protein, partial [Thermoplasmatales archaeon]|nr:right-handed parallel beta-helix repeat-containing protein [Thermoplasmatales archaeon]
TLSNNKDWNGVTCVDGSNPMIFNNTISSNGDMGIWCNRSSSPVILQNTIVDNKRYGVFCGNSSSPTVTRNNITLNEWGIVCEDYCYCSPFINNNFIVNNNKTHYTDGLMDGQGGIYIGSKTSPTVVNNTVAGLHFYGIYCYNPSPPIENPTVNNKLLSDYWSATPTIINNTLLNNYWSFVFYEASNITVENCNVSSNLFASAGVIGDSSNNITIINSTINTYNANCQCDLWLYSKSNITLINTTFNKTKISWGDQSSTLTVGWYLNVKVTDKNSIPIPDAAIVVYNSSDAEIYNEGTNLDGVVKDIVCIEKTQNATEYTMHTPHNITVSKEQYFTNYTSVMMNASKGAVIILEHAYNTTGLIASWHFNENAGDTVYDSSGNNNDGAVYGAIWTTGVNGSALSFDGENDYVEVPDNDSLDITDAITIEAWIYPKGWGEGSLGSIADKNWQTGYAFYLKNTEGQESIKFASNNAGVVQTADSGSITLNEWQHVVVTYDRQNVVFYVNGINKGGGAETNAIGTNSESLFIGNDMGTACTFNGIIDEVRIYNRALNATEIQAHYEEYASANNPPNIPSNPSPSNSVTGQNITVDLSWTGGDPDAGDTVTYDVYFDSTDGSTLVSNDQTGTTYDPGTLSYNTHYYWKIIATDNHNESTKGPVWDF